MENLALPLVLREGYLDRTGLHDSMVCSIGLLLSCRPGMMSFDEEFGCNIWEREYSDMLSANKAEIRASLRNAIAKYEKRLFDVSVSFTTPERNIASHLGVIVRVTGNYIDEGEEKHFEANFNLG